MADDSISKFLGMKSIDDVIQNKQEIVEYNSKVPVEPAKADPRKDEDFESARDALNQVLQLGVPALDEVAKIAEQSQNPQAYEKMGAMMNSVAAAAKTLMDLHKRKKELDKVELDDPRLKDPDGQPEIHNHLHITTSDLAIMMERARKAKESGE